MDEVSKEEAIRYIEEVYNNFKEHTLCNLTSGQLSQVDDVMSSLVHLMSEV